MVVKSANGAKNANGALRTFFCFLVLFLPCQLYYILFLRSYFALLLHLIVRFSLFNYICSRLLLVGK